MVEEAGRAIYRARVTVDKRACLEKGYEISC